MITPAIPLPGTVAELVKLGHGVSCQWIENGRVLNLRLDNVSRDAIDIFINAVDAYLSAIPNDYDSLMLYEIGSVPLTPYLRTRTDQIVKNHTEQRGKGAVVLRSSTFTVLIQRFVEWEVQRQTQMAKQRVFTSREVALRWLLEG